MERVEVAVVGAGLLGSAAARALAARGVPAVLCEQFGLGHARGSSHGATRIFRLSYPDPLYVRLAMRAGEAWARLAAEAGEELLITTGGLDAGPGADACAAALAECGAEHTWLTADEVSARCPWVAVRPGERMLFQPSSGVCLAGRTVAALQRLARRDGASLRAHTPVLRIEPAAGGVALHTPAGEIRARAAVVAPGGWAPGLLAGMLARVPPMTTTLQQVQYYRPRDPAAGAGWPTLIEWPALGTANPGERPPGTPRGDDGSWRQAAMTHRAPTPIWYAVPPAGGAPGVKVGAHVPGPAVDPRDGPFETDPGQQARATEYVRSRLPGLEPRAREPETCLYTMTQDEDFVIDRQGPVVVGGGCSGHAFKFGPLLGELLAGLALGEEVALPGARWSLSRQAPAARPTAARSP